MAENQANIPDPDAEASKPKRGRKRKTSAETATEVVASEVAAPLTVETETVVAASMVAETDETTVLAETSVTTVSSTWYSSCGGALKAAREAQGLSIQEVSKQLRLGVNQIQAIEQDDFGKLPQKSIVRGFIRNYARLLKVDAAPVLLAYQQLVPDSSPASLSVKSNASQSVIESQAKPWRPSRLLSPAVWLLVISLASYFYVAHIKPHTLKTTTQSLDATNEAAAVTNAAPADNAPAAVTETAPAQADATATTPSDNAPSVAEPTATPAIAAPVSEPATATSSTPAVANTAANTLVSSPTPASDAASTAIKALDPNKATLDFKVTEDSWIRIEDGQGKKVFSQILTAGSEQSLTLDKPLNITVGNAGVTRMSIDHQPYDLTLATRGRVARIQLK